MASRQNILSLYRRCIRSANQIPDAGQRTTYLDYVRDGFHRKAGLPRDSREASSAYRDAIEQADSMEYYQRMAKSRNQNNAIKVSVQSATVGGEDFLNCTPARNEAAANQTSRQSKVLSWLTLQLPHLHNEDAELYCQRLIDDGFDSVAFIEQELMEDDLDFMKKAHKRVLVRQLERIRKGR